MNTPKLYHWVHGGKCTVAADSVFTTGAQLKQRVGSTLAGLGLAIKGPYQTYAHLPGVGYTVSVETVEVYTGGTYRDAEAIGELLKSRKI